MVGAVTVGGFGLVVSLPKCGPSVEPVALSLASLACADQLWSVLSGRPLRSTWTVHGQDGAVAHGGTTAEPVASESSGLLLDVGTVTVTVRPGAALPVKGNFPWFWLLA